MKPPVLYVGRGYLGSIEYLISIWEWAKRNRVTAESVMSRWGVSRATAFRWARQLNNAKERYCRDEAA